MDVIVIPLTRISKDRVSQVEGSKVVLGLWALPRHIWVVLLGLLVEGRLYLRLIGVARNMQNFIECKRGLGVKPLNNSSTENRRRGRKEE